jgi:TonB family protein
VNKDFKIDRNSFQEILASAFLVQQSKLEKTFFNTVAEIEQLMEKDHFSVDTIAEIPVEESLEVPINEGNEEDVRLSSQDQPTPSEELETSLPVDAAPNHDALIRSRDPWTTPVIVLAIMLVLTLGWMLGRVSWRSTAIKPKPVIPAPSQDTLNSRERNDQSDVSPLPQVLPKNKNSQAISDSLVIYQNGRVIFRTDPASGSPRPQPGDAKAKSSSDGSPTVRVAYKIEPQYPELAKQQRIEGPVLMEAVIGGKGEVQQLDVISGPTILARAASAAVRKWRFTLPPSSPREFTIRITVNFRL